MVRIIVTRYAVKVRWAIIIVTIYVSGGGIVWVGVFCQACLRLSIAMLVAHVTPLVSQVAVLVITTSTTILPIIITAPLIVPVIIVALVVVIVALSGIREGIRTKEIKESGALITAMARTMKNTTIIWCVTHEAAKPSI